LIQYAPFRFYIVGCVHFRQDQLHIDLFVFFSVFFSGFFLFLSACIVFWQTNASRQMRRNRMRREMEMQSMSKRPFGSHFMYLGDDSQVNKNEVTGKTRKRKVEVKAAELRPVVVQALFADKSISVTTVLVRLPQEENGDAFGKIAFGSALVTTAEKTSEDVEDETQRLLSRRRSSN
jgi:hypothetical protein